MTNTMRRATEEARERLAELRQDALDHAYLTSDMTEQEYKWRCDAIEKDARP